MTCLIVTVRDLNHVNYSIIIFEMSDETYCTFTQMGCFHLTAGITKVPVAPLLNIYTQQCKFVKQLHGVYSMYIVHVLCGSGIVCELCHSAYVTVHSTSDSSAESVFRVQAHSRDTSTDPSQPKDKQWSRFKSLYKPQCLQIEFKVFWAKNMQ